MASGGDAGQRRAVEESVRSGGAPLAVAAAVAGAAATAADVAVVVLVCPGAKSVRLGHLLIGLGNFLVLVSPRLVGLKEQLTQTRDIYISAFVLFATGPERQLSE